MKKELRDMNHFIENLKKELEDSASADIRAHTPFRNLPEWSSLQALIVVNSFEEEYGVAVSEEELQNAQTIGDLYDLVNNKISE